MSQDPVETTNVVGKAVEEQHRRAVGGTGGLVGDGASTGRDGSAGLDDPIAAILLGRVSLISARN